MAENTRHFNSRRLLTPAVHILFIGMIFILPELLMRVAFPWRGPMPWTVYAKSGIMIAVFYINYFWVIPKTLGRGNRWIIFILYNLLLIAVAEALMYWVTSLGHHGWMYRKHEPSAMQIMVASASFILRDVTMLLLTVSLATVMRLSDKWIELERSRQKLRAAQRESELENLRSQLNPHFLFNTLNTIYALIAISPDEAQKAVHELSSLLRYVVYENPDKVPVKLETDFVSNYVDLMRLRMGDRPVQLTVDENSTAEMPPLLFVTLVENAFKHGNTADTSLPIKIEIKAEDGRIECTTENSVDAVSDTTPAKSGVGLANLRRRLELIYGDDARLDMNVGNDRICRVTLSIPAL